MAKIEVESTNLKLPLPNADNFLVDDVQRLIDALNLIDKMVGRLDGPDGRLLRAQLPEGVVQLDQNNKVDLSLLPDVLVRLNQDNVVDAAQLPSSVKVNLHNVSTQNSMLALNATPGDVAILTLSGNPVPRTFMLIAAPATDITNWRELGMSVVTSVNGQFGAITGLAGSGANNDITSLEALSGPLRLGGEGVGDYDAVTMKQLRAGGGGGGGGGSNGVMGDYLGSVQWFNGTMAKMPAGYVPSNGQLLARADYPDLWKMIEDGYFNSVSDAKWLAGETAVQTPPGGTATVSVTNKAAHRGKYSTGDGSTTFRMPDLNGAQPDSIAGLFLRGNGGAAGAANSISHGSVVNPSYPNIMGDIVPAYSATATMWDAGSGAFSLIGATTNKVGNPTINASAGASARGGNIRFNAYLSSNSYGKQDAIANVDGSIRNFSGGGPANAIGMWIIRATGAFVAANTSFQIVTGDATKPAANTRVQGGELLSQYMIAGKQTVASSFAAIADIGNNITRTRLRSYNGDANVTSDFFFTSTGQMVAGNIGLSRTPNTWTKQGDEDHYMYVLPADAGLSLKAGQMMFTTINGRGWTFNPKGDANNFTTIGIGSLELCNKTPFIDFHYDSKAGFDFTHRIITTSPDILSFQAGNNSPNMPSIWVDVLGAYMCRSGMNDRTGYGTASNTARHGFNIFWTPAGTCELWIDTSRVAFFQSGFAGTISDAELKEKISYREDVDAALDEVNRWKPVDFRFKRQEGAYDFERQMQFGFLANDLIEVSPEVIRGEGLKPGDDINDVEVQRRAYEVDAIALIAKLTQAVQALTKRNEELEKRLEALENA